MLIAMAATIESVYRELKILRTEIKDLKNVLVPEVEPEEDELNAIVEGGKKFKAGKYTVWNVLKVKRASNV